jgi:hypothetical protein
VLLVLQVPVLELLEPVELLELMVPVELLVLFSVYLTP